MIIFVYLFSLQGCVYPRDLFVSRFKCFLPFEYTGYSKGKQFQQVSPVVNIYAWSTSSFRGNFSLFLTLSLSIYMYIRTWIKYPSVLIAKHCLSLSLSLSLFFLFFVFFSITNSCPTLNVDVSVRMRG